MSKLEKVARSICRADIDEKYPNSSNEDKEVSVDECWWLYKDEAKDFIEVDSQHARK